MVKCLDIQEAAEVPWFVQPREEETKERLHSSLHLPGKGSRRSGTDLSGDSDRT